MLPSLPPSHTAITLLSQANLAYAYALLGYDPVFEYGTALLENTAEESTECISGFNEQDISNLVWAYATLKVSHPLLFQSVGDAVTVMPKTRVL